MPRVTSRRARRPDQSNAFDRLAATLVAAETPTTNAPAAAAAPPEGHHATRIMRPVDELMMDDDAIRTVVTRLARPHPSGGAVIERAAILAEGAESASILAWIEAQDGRPEELAVKAAPTGGLHSGRGYSGAPTESKVPRRYVLPPGVIG